MFAANIPKKQLCQFSLVKQLDLQKIYHEINLIDNNIIKISYDGRQRNNNNSVSTKKTFHNVLKIIMKYENSNIIFNIFHNGTIQCMCANIFQAHDLFNKIIDILGQSEKCMISDVKILLEEY